jgi:hypothetical protein
VVLVADQDRDRTEVVPVARITVERQRAFVAELADREALARWLVAEARWERDQAELDRERAVTWGDRNHEQWERHHQEVVLPYVAELEAVRDLLVWLHAEAVWQRDQARAAWKRSAAMCEQVTTALRGRFTSEMKLRGELTVAVERLASSEGFLRALVEAMDRVWEAAGVDPEAELLELLETVRRQREASEALLAERRKDGVR